MSKIMPVNRRLLPEGDAGKLNDEGLRGLLKQVGGGVGHGWVESAEASAGGSDQVSCGYHA